MAAYGTERGVAAGGNVVEAAEELNINDEIKRGLSSCRSEQVTSLLIISAARVMVAPGVRIVTGWM